MSMRSTLNQVQPNNALDILREVGFGDLLNALIKALAFTETAIAVTTNVATLAAQPSSLGVLRALATAETGTSHEKKILIGPVSGPQALVPAVAQCVWDGGVKVLFNSVDAVTAASFLYAKDSDTTAGALQRDLGVRQS